MPTKPAVVSAETVRTITTGDSVSIRVSPNSYFIALFISTFFTGFLVYLEIDWAAALLFVLSWICIPFLAFTDRIVFDGKRISRTGFLPDAWAWLNGSRSRLKFSDIEQAETQALRALKRGGSVFYRYRTAIRGKDVHFAFASGGEDYRRMVRRIFPMLSENVLDNRSIELRDYLSEPKETLMKAEFEQIPSPEVLESSLRGFYSREKNLHALPVESPDHEDREKAEELRRLANELRLSGHLLQALEAFRRALVLNPRDNWILFELARCMQSFAGSERDKKMERRALALLRLAERRAQNDGELLARLGESYFQFGEWERAGKVFQRALDRVETSFRSVRGLAEIALREGKIAHVIHHFFDRHSSRRNPCAPALDPRRSRLLLAPQQRRHLHGDGSEPHQHARHAGALEKDDAEDNFRWVSVDNCRRSDRREPRSQSWLGDLLGVAVNLGRPDHEPANAVGKNSARDGYGRRLISYRRTKRIHPLSVTLTDEKCFPPTVPSSRIY